MFDVTTARMISYGPGNDQTVVVFQDRDSTQKNIWYMVPVPRLRMQNGQPAFSLTRYRTSAGGVTGVCTFSVEVYTPEEAKKAAKEQIRGIAGWGQFIWIGGQTFFNFDLEVDGKQNSMSIESSPSLFGSNVTNFQIELKSAADVTSFAKAFTTPGTVSPFLVAYDLVVLTQLLAAKATVAYKSTTAIEYEKTYKTTKDTWGNKKTVQASVRQTLKQSGAGEVTVTPGVGATKELVQLVRDWAWSTLETQVADVVESARALAVGNTNPVAATSDFTTTYSEDAIVEWSTPVSRFLPRFDDATWKRVYHEVDNRQLVVTFQLSGNAYDSTGNLLFTHVDVQVDYPTRQTDNTFRLIPGTDDRVAKTYVAAGTSPFRSDYRYKYTVHFPDTPTPYTSDWLTSDSTSITLLPNQFGIRNVSFVGVDVPFGGLVKEVLIDFYDNPPPGQPPKLQTKRMAENGPEATFLSTYRVPITNTYEYRLCYLLNNGARIIVQPGRRFGSDNADVVPVFSPAPSVANLDLRALVTKKGRGFLEVNINAAYFDPQNTQSGPLTHSWSGWSPPAPAKNPTIHSAPERWTFDAQPDPQTAFFRLNGQIVFGDGSSFEIRDLNLAYALKPLILYDTEVLYSVKIFTDQIDWTAVARVTVNLFQLTDDDDEISSGDGTITISRAFIAPLSELTSAERDEILRSTSGLVDYTILPLTEGVKTLPLYYTVRKLRSDKTVVFYFNGEYAMKDGTVVTLADTRVDGRLQITLPKLPSQGGDPGVGIQRLEVEVSSD